MLLRAFSNTGERVLEGEQLSVGKKKIIKILLVQQSSGMRLTISLCLIFRYMLTERFKKYKVNAKLITNVVSF